MNWGEVPPFDAGHRAVLENAKPFVFVGPPAAWACAPLLDYITDSDTSTLSTLILAPEIGDARDFENLFRNRADTHLVTGLDRSTALLSRGRVRTLLGAAHDVLQLIRRSALPTTQIKRIIAVWPEHLVGSDGTQIYDDVLSEVPDAQRLVVTTSDTSIRDFIERHARRAPTYRIDPTPVPIIQPVRFAIVDQERMASAVRNALDTLNPDRAVIWDPWTRALETQCIGTSTLSDETPDDTPFDIGIAVEFPTTAVLRRLQEVAREVLLLIRPNQQPHLAELTQGNTKSVKLSGELDRARHWATNRREALRQVLEKNALGKELMVIEPLLDEFDPVEIAAAALASAPVSEEPTSIDEGWTRVFVDVGKKDEVRPGDFVGLLLNAAGIRKDAIGRIDIRDRFSLIDIRPAGAPRAVQGLSGQVVRGKRATARLDKR